MTAPSPTSLATPDVLITDAEAVLRPAAEHLEAHGISVEILPSGVSPTDAAMAATDVRVVMIGMMPFGAQQIGLLRRTGLIIRAGIGYDMVDLASASDAGIMVTNVPDYCVDEVADHTMMLLAAAMRRLPDSLTMWRSRAQWSVAGSLPEMRRVRGKRLGIVGFGRIGRQVADRARAFGWEVLAFDPLASQNDETPGVRIAELDEVLETSDAISLHCPLNETTNRLMRRERFRQLKKGCVLVNTSRGGLVDLDDLCDALNDGAISMAALDVLEDEPNPDLNRSLLSDPRVIVTPHVAWRSTEAQLELAIQSASEAIRFLNGQNPVNVVNRDLLV